MQTIRRQMILVILCLVFFFSGITCTEIFGVTLEESLSKTLDSNRIGAKAMSMGGAFTGLADDATAIYWNPAGLTQQEKLSISTSYRFNYNESVRFGYYDIRDDVIIKGLGTSSFVLPVDFLALSNKNVVLACGVDYQEGLLNLSNQHLISTGYYTITPAMALEIRNGISLGLNVNIRTGTSTGLSYSAPFPEVESKSESSFRGNSFSVGVLFDLHKANLGVPVSIGISYKTAYMFEVNRTILNIYRYGVSVGAKYNYEIDIPEFYSIGFAFKPDKDVVLTADYEMRNWKNTVTRISSDSEDREEEYLNSLSGNDINQIRIGLEVARDINSYRIFVRTGYAFVPTLIADKDQIESTRERIYRDQVDSDIFSVGLGCLFKNIRVDMAYLIQRYNRKDHWYTYWPNWDPVVITEEESIDQQSFNTFMIEATIFLGK